MNYIGRCLNNFKEFYNEINAATLTGAIDVIVVQQQDGSYLSSPFHVRFGKIGVLKSKEKMVDIEINGVPVDIHMKLGESGEAFFVSPLEDGEQLASHQLATSPLPEQLQLFPAPQLEPDWSAPHADTQPADAGRSHTTQSNQAVFDAQSEVKTATVAVEAAAAAVAAAEEAVVAEVQDAERLIGENNGESYVGGGGGGVCGPALTAEPTSSVSCRCCRTEPHRAHHHHHFQPITDAAAQASVISDGKPRRRSRRKRAAGHHRTLSDIPSWERELPPAPTAAAATTAATAQLLLLPAGVCCQPECHPFSDTDISRPSSRSGSRRMSPVKSDTEFEVERERVHQVKAAAVNLDGAAAGGGGVGGAGGAGPDGTNWTWGELPVTPGAVASATVTPAGATAAAAQAASPEVLAASVDARSAKAGDDTQEDIAAAAADNAAALPSAEGTLAGGGGGGVGGSVSQQQNRSMLTDMFSFMRKTRRVRHDPLSEGVYLDDLDLQSLDPEVAALYFPRAHVLRHKTAGDGGRGGGVGSAVLASGSGAECALECDEGHGSSATSSPPPSALSVFGSCGADVALSLCGAAAEPSSCSSCSCQPHQQQLDTLTEHQFASRLVSYEQLAADPWSVLQRPELVVRVDGRYMHWSEAAPQLCSLAAFGKQLPATTTRHLSQQQQHHQQQQQSALNPETTAAGAAAGGGGADGGEEAPSKKVPSVGYSYWFSWRRASDTHITSQRSTAAPPAATPSTAPPAVTTTTVTTDGSPHNANESDTVSASAAASAATADTAATATSADTAATVSPAAATTTATVTSDELVAAEPAQSDVFPDVNNDVTSNSEHAPADTDQSTDAVLHGAAAAAGSAAAGGGRISESDDVAAELAYDRGQQQYKKSLRLTSEQVECLGLKPGRNEAQFSVTTAYQGTTRCHCGVFLWRYDDRVVISDIDGTITKSDVLGHILPIIGQNWAQSGVTSLFTHIHDNGYRFLYLSARAIGQAPITREYLRSVKQDSKCLPEGPLLLSPSSLVSALHREVIEKRPEDFKIPCLKDIAALFPGRKPLYAGFGNRVNDALSYRAVQIPYSRIFTINHRGELRHELTQAFQSSYTNLTDLVDHFFPYCASTDTADAQEFNDFTFWRCDLPPLTPTAPSTV